VSNITTINHVFVYYRKQDVMIGIAIALYSMIIWYQEIILISLIVGPYYYYRQSNQLSYTQDEESKLEESENKFENSDH
jgi:hypothetical protein